MFRCVFFFFFFFCSAHIMHVLQRDNMLKCNIIQKTCEQYNYFTCDSSPVSTTYFEGAILQFLVDGGFVAGSQKLSSTWSWFSSTHLTFRYISFLLYDAEHWEWEKVAIFVLKPALYRTKWFANGHTPVKPRQHHLLRHLLSVSDWITHWIKSLCFQSSGTSNQQNKQ